QNMGFREFLTRGLKSVKMEYDLVCTGHNLKIIWNKIGRNRGILRRIADITAQIASNTRFL
ncbi:MAG: IS5/IS1182 family transposase, partial [Thermoplasmata archaeon]